MSKLITQVIDGLEIQGVIHIIDEVALEWGEPGRLFEGYSRDPKTHGRVWFEVRRASRVYFMSLEELMIDVSSTGEWMGLVREAYEVLGAKTPRVIRNLGYVLEKAFPKA